MKKWLKTWFVEARFWKIFLPIVLAVVGIRVNFTYSVVVGDSMSPTLKTGDVVVANRWSTPNDNDIVIFRSAEGIQIKRVMVVGPGFWGVTETYVPTGFVFLAGDGSNSAEVGLMPLNSVLGVARLTIYSAGTKLVKTDPETTEISNREVGPAQKPKEQIAKKLVIQGESRIVVRADENTGGDGVIITEYDMKDVYLPGSLLFCPQTDQIYKVLSVRVSPATELGPNGYTKVYVDPAFHSPTLGTKVYLIK